MTENGPPADLPLRVSTLELFFDLVFVFAITQLTGILVSDMTLASGLRVLLIFGALWWMYDAYTWLANARTPSGTQERLLLLVGMAGFLIIGLSVPHAFGADGVAFGLGYLAGDALFRQVLRIGALRYRAAAAVASLAVSAVGVTLSVAAEIALLTAIVAAALAAERRRADTVEA
jgi:low temperature requirement protein LtrA